jgi:DNA topoisomerase-1
MANLLIVESPAKCGKIQGFLGPGWRVIATMGHIRALEEDLGAVGLDRDFEARFEFLKEKSKAVAQIKEAARAATTIYLASDDDREGEAISYSVAVLLKLDLATAPRAVFHEITESAVKAAVAAPRRIDMNRVNAQQARAILDMMVGFTISPLLWKYVGAALSAGRCQTPALRLLVDREREIGGFQAETAWRIAGSFKCPRDAGIPSFEATMVGEIADRESAENYLENVHADPEATVQDAVQRPWTESAPPPLITSTLQQEVSATMGIQPKNTMRIAQRLYEAGHITYMRTDSAVLSEEARAAAEEIVRRLPGGGEAYVAGGGVVEAAAAKAPKVQKKSAKVAGAAAPPAAQEAHEAIRPTHFELRDLPTEEDWNASDRKVYRLIWMRAVQSVMAAAKGQQLTIGFKLEGDPDSFRWSATARKQTFAGWRLIGSAATNLDAEDGEAATAAAESKAHYDALATIQPADTLRWTSLTAAPHTTKPPGRYTEATLVRELERKGIGRPSTFAQLVGTIIDKGYAEKRDTPAKEVATPRLTLSSCGQWPPTQTAETKRTGAEKQKLAPTALGTSVLEFCVREFANLFAYEFTAQMEARLDAIATGAEPWKQLCRDTWNSYKAHYETLKAGKSTAAAAPEKQRTFASGLKAVQSKKGPLLLREGPGKGEATFYGWPVGVAFGELTEEAAEAFVAARLAATAGEPLGEYEGQPIVKKSGPFGPYAECAGVKVPLKPEDTADTIVAKLAAKATAALHTLGPFEFRTSQYGVYFFKRDQVGKARKFVGLPSGVDPKTLTLEAATKLFQAGLQQKAKGSAFAKKKKPSE